jgi:class 3 adenylate cyclase
VDVSLICPNLELFGQHQLGVEHVVDHIPKELEKFLRTYSPEAETMIAAFAEHNTWTRRDFSPDEPICSTGERAEAIWLILDGKIEIRAHGKSIRFREAGELVGEQAFLRSLNGKPAVRQADMIARGNVSVACIDASFHEQLKPEQRVVWFQTLAILVNEKLEEATTGRAKLQEFIDNRDSLLSRFADEEAIGLVKRAADDEEPPPRHREAIVWFSDVAGFSTWSKDKAPEEAARIIKAITGSQVDNIRRSRGLVDKIIGDGVMAFWFTDTTERRKLAPLNALECAQASVNETNQFLKSQGLESHLDIRIGLHCGPVVFGDFGAKNRIAVTLLGQTVNTAARYEQAKMKGLGRIRISPELKNKVLEAGGDAQFSFYGPTKVSIKESEITIFSI